MHISMFAVGVVDCVVVVALVVAQPAAVARSRLTYFIVSRAPAVPQTCFHAAV